MAVINLDNLELEAIKPIKQLLSQIDIGSTFLLHHPGTWNYLFKLDSRSSLLY